MKNKKGFTLIEIIVALAILAILGAVAVPIYRGYMTGSAKSEAKSNLQTLSMLLDTYYSDNAKYAPANDTYDWINDSSGTVTTNEFSSWLPSFQPKKATGGAAANYDYTLVTTTTSTTADTYTATAAPRSGTVVAGSGNLTITQNGTKTGW